VDNDDNDDDADDDNNNNRTFLFHFTIYKQVTKKATTLYTSRLTAQQLNTLDFLTSTTPAVSQIVSDLPL